MKVIFEREVRELKRLEQIVQKGLKAFAEAGFALRQIRDQKLYRQSHGTFEKYCEEKWGFGNRHANRLIQAGEVIENLESSNGTNWSRLPATESQARELAKAAPEAQAEIWQEVTETTEKPTAADVKAAVQRRNKVVQAEIVDDDGYADVPDDEEPEAFSPARPANPTSDDPVIERSRRKLRERLRGVRLDLGNLGLGGRFEPEIERIEKAAGLFADKNMEGRAQ